MRKLALANYVVRYTDTGSRGAAPFRGHVHQLAQQGDARVHGGTRDSSGHRQRVSV